jgi:starch synthase
MKILFAASEVFPFAKTGGLADVAGSLPLALKRLGHDVRVILPRYRMPDPLGKELQDTGAKVHVRVGERIITGDLLTGSLSSDVPVYFVRYDPYFDRERLYGTVKGDYPDNASRFIFFSRAILDTMKSLDFWPEILHLNDWQTGLAALYLKTYKRVRNYSKVSSVFTIHNLAFQGLFWHYDLPLTGLGWDIFTPRGIEFYGRINFMKAGLIAADLITTVSKKYAQEIQTPEYGCGLDGVLRERSQDLYGILNGVDYDFWNPETDPLIPVNYSRSSLEGKTQCKAALLKEFGLGGRLDRPLIGCVSRLTGQKGFDLIAEIAEDLAGLDLALVILGDGDETYRKRFAALAEKFGSRFGIRVGYDNALAHRIEAGADFFLMPSRYEPCGLNQMYSLKYGTIPIVRATGGLDDTITNFNQKTKKGNGFKFSGYSSRRLFQTLRRGLDVYANSSAWKQLVTNAMACDFSWDRSARAYEKLYKQLIKKNPKTYRNGGISFHKDRI